jgi:D-Tyr-tRNAtyr deacylase
MSFVAPIARRCATLVAVGVLLSLAACGTDEQVVSTPSPESSPDSHVAADYFPVTVVVETDRGWVTILSVTKEEIADDDTAVRLAIDGNLKVLSAGRFDYALSLTDSEGNVYRDSGGLLLGERQQGEEPSYHTSITVPAHATLARVGYWVAGSDTPELSYLIELPVAGIPPVTR